MHRPWNTMDVLQSNLRIQKKWIIFQQDSFFLYFFCRFCQSISNIERIESFERVTTKKKKVQKNQRKNLIFFSFGIFFSIFYFRAVFFCFCSFTRSVNCGLGLQTRFTTYGNCGRFFFLYFSFLFFSFPFTTTKMDVGNEPRNRDTSLNQKSKVLYLVLFHDDRIGKIIWSALGLFFFFFCCCCCCRRRRLSLPSLLDGTMSRQLEIGSN